MRSVYCKARARVLRWQEEITLLLEEMRRVVAYFVWRRNWWLKRRNLRPQAPADIQSGTNAYAERQALVFEGLARRVARRWKVVVNKQALVQRWPSSVDTLISSLTIPANPSAGVTVVDHPVPPPEDASHSQTALTAIATPHSSSSTPPTPQFALRPDSPATDGQAEDATNAHALTANQHHITQQEYLEDPLVNEEDFEISDDDSDDEVEGYYGPDQYDSD